MNICFVTAPTATEFKQLGELRSKSVRWAVTQPPLGILSLAAVLLRRGRTADIIDLNSVYIDWVGSLCSAEPEDFAQVAAEMIAARNADVYGFGSICSSYPLTIRIAEALKHLRPQSLILFGGPQATVVDVATLQAFPSVDLVLRGEAEQSLPVLLDQLANERQLENVPGLTYRLKNRLGRNPNANLIESLDELPLPAYHLAVDLRNATKIPLELGRGCPYACTFCSTNDFFRRKFRLRSPGRLLQDMRQIESEYGVRDFELVHDMFTVDRRRVASFCEAMIASGEKFTWSCSARTDSVDAELLELMARAGCNGIFYGVEVGSVKMQKIIDKNLDPNVVHEIIDITERQGIHSTVSMIIGFPEETFDDLQETLAVYMHSARCLHSNPQLNLLAPLAETPLHSKYRGEMVLEELCSDMSHQGGSQEQADLVLIRQYPDIFPNFYLLPTLHLDPKVLLELREFALNAIQRLRWLIVAIDQGTTGILDFFLEWRAHRLSHQFSLHASDLRHYYRTEKFCRDFLAYTKHHAVGNQPAVRAFLEYEDAMRHSIDPDKHVRPMGELLAPGTPLVATDVAVRKAGTRLIELSCDIQSAIDALKLRSEPVCGIGTHLYVVREVSSGTSGVQQISRWLGCLLRNCDGRHTVEEIVSRLGSDVPDVPPSLADHVFGQLLEGAHAKGFVEIYRGHAQLPQKHPIQVCPARVLPPL